MANFNEMIDTIIDHERKLKAIKDWIVATNASLNVLEDTVVKLLEFSKDDSRHILEHEHRLARLEAMLDVKK